MATKSAESTRWKRCVSSSLAWSRWIMLVALPGLVAGFGGFSSTKTGATKRNLIIAAVVSAVLLAALNVYRELRTRYLTRSARAEKSLLAMKLGKSGQPLIQQLNIIAETNDPGQRRLRVETLLARAIGITNEQCGRLNGVRCETRAVFYQFDGPNRLVRRLWEGREDPRAPRLDFLSERSRSDKVVVEAAQGEDRIFVRNVDETPPEHFADYKGRVYKTLIMVPVRNQIESFGFFAVDSDHANSLVDADVSYVKLVAAILAVGFTLLTDSAQTVGSQPELPRQKASERDQANPDEGATR